MKKCLDRQRGAYHAMSRVSNLHCGLRLSECLFKREASEYGAKDRVRPAIKGARCQMLLQNEISPVKISFYTNVRANALTETGRIKDDSLFSLPRA